MTKNLHVATSPLTGTIFAGSVLKDGRTWGVSKKDVTVEALYAVAEHVLQFGKPVEISKFDGTPEFKITVERLGQEIESPKKCAAVAAIEYSPGTRSPKPS